MPHPPTDQATQAEALQRAAHIQLMIFDVDGILTDGSLHFTAEGESVKVFNVLDGHGIKLLHHFGIRTAIISARQSTAVARRAADLQMHYLHQGAHDKLAVFHQLQKDTGFAESQLGFIGDDVIDLPILIRAGFAASVPNGHLEVRRRVHYVTEALGGRGAVREVCDFILQAQNHYASMLESYLK